MSSETPKVDPAFADWLTERATARNFDVSPGGGGRSALARAAGVSPAQIGRALDRKAMPSHETLRALAEPLGVTVLEVFLRAEILQVEDLIVPFRPDPSKDYSAYKASDVADELPKIPKDSLDAAADRMHVTPQERRVLVAVVEATLGAMRDPEFHESIIEEAAAEAEADMRRS